MAKAPTRTDIVRLAGLDRTTERLTAEHAVVLKRQASAFWRFARNRLAKLDERLRPRDLLLRAGGWTVATIGIIVALTFLTPIVITHATVNIMIFGGIIGGIIGGIFGLTYGLIFGVTFGLAFGSISGLMSGAIVGGIVGGIGGGIGGAIFGVIFGMNGGAIFGMIGGAIGGAIKTALITAKPRVVKIRKYRKNLLPYLFPPIMPFVRLFDAWLVAHREHPALVAISEEARNSPEKYIEETYLRGLARVREEFLGEESLFTQTANELYQQRRDISSRLERLRHRIRGLRNDETDRERVLRGGMQDLQTQEVQIQEGINRTETLRAKTETLLLELESDVHRLSGPLGDAKLIREIQEGGVKNENLLARANANNERAVERLGETLVQLHAIIADALIAPRTNGEMRAYYQRLDEATEKIVSLERDARDPDALLQ